jgi:hypothetical protein
MFDALLNKDMDRRYISENLSKIASFKTPEDLNEALKKIIKSDDLSADKIIKRIEDENINAEVISNKNNKLIIKIKDFAASKSLGSPQWCISSEEHYYDEYLYKTNLSDNFSGMKEDDDEYDSLEKGNHVFLYDFNKEENDPMSQFAFTVSANSIITASHDKNDDDILEELNLTVRNKNQKQIIKKVMPFDKSLENESRRLMSIQSEDFLGDSYTIIKESRNPLRLFKMLIETNNSILYTHSNMDVQSILLHQSLRDYNDYNDLTADEMIVDLIWLENFIQKQFPENKDERSPDEEEYFEYHDEEKISNHKCEIKSGDVIKSDKCYEIFKDVSNIKKDIIFKQFKEQLCSILKEETAKIYHNRLHNTCKPNSEHGTLTTLNKTMITEYASNFLSLNDSNEIKLTDFDKEQLIISNVYHTETPTKNMVSKFIKLIDDGKLNINKIFSNHENFNNEILDKCINLVNENPKIITGISNYVILDLSKSEYILNKLSDKTCLKIKEQIYIKMIRGDFNELYDNQKSRNNHTEKKYNFIERMKNLFDTGIMDHEIAKTINSSRIANGEVSKIYKETGLSAVEYITSGLKKVNSSFVEEKNKKSEVSFKI